MNSPRHSDSSSDSLAEDRELWKLLENQSVTPEHPYLSRRVLKQLEKRESTLTPWLNLHRMAWVGLGVVALTLTFVFFITQSPQSSLVESDTLSEQKYAETLLHTAAEEPILLSDEELIALLF